MRSARFFLAGIDNQGGFILPFATAVFIPFLWAGILPFLQKMTKRLHPGWWVVIPPFGLFCYFLTFIPGVLEGHTYTSTLQWVPSLAMAFSIYIDGLSLLFVLLISGIGTLIALYSIYYLNRNEKLIRFYVFLLLFMGAMLGVVLADNLFILYTFWEITSFSSFLLIGYWHRKKSSRDGALKSLIITVFGGFSLLFAFVFLYVSTGTTSIRQLVAHPEWVAESPYHLLILFLILLGAFTKSAQFPFHIWLPDAMAAPTPVSAYLHSATMVKAGIYLVARMSPFLNKDETFFYIVSGFGLITLCWCAYLASRQTDLKAILAYSTLSQLGMIMAMIGYGTPLALLAAIFHIFNHATFKGSLFMIAGIIDHETGTRDIRKLGGLLAVMPVSATLAFFAAFSMAAVPLPVFSGFLSKEMFFSVSLAAAETVPVIWILALIGSIFTFVYSMYFYFYTFTGKGKDLPKKPHDPPFGMLVSPLVLVAFVVFVGLFPNAISELFAAGARAVTGANVHADIHFWHGLKPPFLMSLGVVVCGVLLFLSLPRWRVIYSFLPGAFTVNRLYVVTLQKFLAAARKITRQYMTGSLRNDLSFIFAFLILFSAATFFVEGGLRISFADTAPLSTPELVVAFVMMLAALATIAIKRRIGAILSLGVVGYGLSLLFVFFRAPDLALTQLVIETITVVLFLLCFARLPELELPSKSKRRAALQVALSVGVGLIVTLTAISAHSTRLFEPIADFFLRHSYDLGGGHNVVNVILVDIRGLDTLFEITVLGLAALAIYGMIHSRKKEETEMKGSETKWKS